MGFDRCDSGNLGIRQLAGCNRGQGYTLAGVFDELVDSRQRTADSRQQTAEGSPKTLKDRRKFYRIALASHREVQAILDITDAPTKLTAAAYHLGASLYKLVKALE